MSLFMATIIVQVLALAVTQILTGPSRLVSGSNTAAL